MINLKIIVTMNRKKLLISLAMTMLSMADVYKRQLVDVAWQEIELQFAVFYLVTVNEVAEEHPAWIQLFQTRLIVINFEVIDVYKRQEQPTGNTLASGLSYLYQYAVFRLPVLYSCLLYTSLWKRLPNSVLMPPSRLILLSVSVWLLRVISCSR